MSRTTIACIILLSFLFLAPRAVLACRCQTPPTSLAYKQADAVVVAKVVHIENRASDEQVATLEASQVWKQDMPARVLVLGGGKICGHFFEVDQEYVLYLRINQDGTYVTSNCVGNKFIKNPKLPQRFTSYALRDIAWLKRYGKAGIVK
jgi:hypothetical protein